MNEAALGVHASSREPVEARPEPPESIDDDSGGGGAGVTLPTLLAAVRLTPAQAAQLVADLAGALERGAGRGRPVAVREDAVMVSDGGRLTIDGADSAASGIEPNDAIVGLFRSIATNCRGSGFGDLLAESVSGTTDPDSLIRRVRRVIDPELDPAGEARRRRQIGELVRATTGRSVPHGLVVEDRDGQTDVRNGPSVPAVSLVTSTGWYPPVRSAWHSRRRRPSRRQGLYAVLAIVILAGSAVAAPRALEQLSRGWNALLDPVNSSTAQNRIEPVSPPPPEPANQTGAATEAGGVAPAPVHTGAPASSGQIAGVTASFADGSCNPGKPCAVRVDVRLDPSAVGAVTWKLNVYDRCTGEVREGGDVTIPAEPGRDGVYGLSRTTLPDASALGVAAVTSAPAVAASEPLYVPAENAVCR
ncbi:hypothetical protein EGT67_06330 [Prescottella agglutinans]|uniref:Uncharacterized protein n=1 Tax=Prescottella agglutinans TaxID=1644129 RepID=A0A3S3AXD2_9NOCA|nr:hypothetical protein [Prescottella agglutinans]RVW10756.1 hypothetical protein EGT67_06330 [Prescottella agglutinans]